jgi:hypothetical protein
MWHCLSDLHFWHGAREGRGAGVRLSYAEMTANKIADDHLLFQNGDVRKAITEIASARQIASRFLNLLYFAAAAMSLFILASGFPKSLSLSFLGVTMDEAEISPSVLIVTLGVLYVFSLQFYANYFILTLAGKRLCETIGVSEFRFATPVQDLIALFVPPVSLIQEVNSGKPDLFMIAFFFVLAILSVIFVLFAFLAPVVCIWNGLSYVPSDVTLFEKSILGLIVFISIMAPIMFLLYIFQKSTVVQ